MKTTIYNTSNIHSPIKAEELRIGNWVMNDANYFEFDVDCFNQINSIQPIPLTEEWLLNFGFNYRNEHRGEGCIMDLKGEKYKSASVAIPYKSQEGRLIYMTVWSAPINYVHQLQNLYYAITGEELKIQGKEAV